MRKVELLAPAGNYEAFLGAVHAGADAVYLGGAKFGARAYADNFTTEELCSAIRYAHIYGKKVYLTLNTLVKTEEFHEIYHYLLPLRQAGLDGVIIQDFGVFRAIGEWFPGLGRHVSTQMAITGIWGAQLLKKWGASRVVPARELSITEIKEMKEASGLEIEIFVHGAICYCYSGQCLFSSLLGGRSGNRGRCAQPCRLPYQTDGERKGKETYPLSLKDMCTIEILPELLEAGVDSLKIEGRMKSAEYAAGVTAVYRKYIDWYYKNPSAEYKVSKEDMEKLRALYIRSGISEGYYHQHNGRQMITLDSPAYAGRDEALALQIRKDYLEGDFRLPIGAKATLKKGAPAVLQLWHPLCCDKTIGKTGKNKKIKQNAVTVTGALAEPAQKRPLEESDVRKQLAKSGNTVFRMEQIEIEMDSDVFLPLKSLNELRRMACEKLEEEMLHSQTEKENAISAISSVSRTDAIRRKELYLSKKQTGQIHVCSMTKEQALAAVRQKAERLYLSSGLCTGDDWWRELKKYGADGANGTELYLALPFILRKRDAKFLSRMEGLLREDTFQGVLARNLEELHWLRETFGKTWDKKIVTDASLYLWNPEAAAMLGEYGRQHYLPYELNARETERLLDCTPDARWGAVIYGRLPMMISANCIVRTGNGCRSGVGNQPAFHKLTDRYQKNFPVYTDCEHCYNIIYNSLPLSLHRQAREMEEMGIDAFRLDFTIETGRQAEQTLRFFAARAEEELQPPYAEYTKGHWKRGVE